MPVLHQYVDPIPDDPASAAAGKVLPSHWNALHTALIDLAGEVSGQLQAANLPTIADARVLGNNSGAPSVPLELTGAQVKLLIGLIDLASEVTGQLPNANLDDMPGATIKGNALGSSQPPQDLTVAETRTLLGLDATGTGAVDSVAAADGSLTISPTTGDVLANINLGHTNTWTITQGITAETPTWRVETTSTSSTLSLAVGAYHLFYNTAGLMLGSGVHTTGYNNPGTVFLPSQATHESYGAGGSLFAAWGTGADIVVAVANGTLTMRESFRVKATGTTQFAAGSTAAGTAPVKFTSGSLMSSAEVGAVEFLTDKWYGTITTGTARKEFTLNDAALTATRVPFATTNGRLTDASTFSFDGTNGRLNLGTAPSTAGNDLYLQKSANGQVGMFVQNTSTGSAAYGIAGVYNSATGINIFHTSTGFTTSGLVVASQSGLECTGAGGLNVRTTTASDITFATNGSATTNERLRIDSNGNVSVGNAALATNATNGFLYIPTCAGVPTGVPTAKAGRVPVVFDTTNNRLYVYDGGWIDTT